MDFRCTNCHDLIAQVSGGSVTICGNATIASSFPPANYSSNWLKCSKCNAWAKSGNSDVSQRLEAERRRRQKAQEDQRRALEAERQRREAERRRQEEARRQQVIQTHKNEHVSYVNNCRDLERQLAIKRQDKQREEKLQESLTEQRNVERNAISKFSQERGDPNVIRFVLIGETGVGKSTLANRLIGDTTRYCDSSSTVFRVGNGIHSVTGSIQKETRNMHLPNGTVKVISVIDTPGLSDSASRDRHHANVLCEYLRGVERIHQFIVVLTAGNPRLDEATLQGLGEMDKMFGRQFWRFVSIVYTGVDNDRVQMAFQSNLTATQERIRRQFALGVSDARLNGIGIGFDYWHDGVTEIIGNADVTKYYTCDKLQSPLEDLESQLKIQTQKVQAINRDINALTARLGQVRSQIESARSSLQGYRICV